MSLIDTEFDVIGITLNSSNGRAEKVFTTLSGDDFSSKEHRVIFSVMQSRYKQGKPLEVLEIVSDLKTQCDHKTLDSCQNVLARTVTKKNREYFETKSEGLDSLIEALGKQTFDITKALRIGAELQTLDISIEYAVEGLIVKRAINTLSGYGGTGKTTISYGVGDAVSKGIPFLGLKTLKMPVVYTDFENSLPVVVERVKRMDATQILFWHPANEIPPPRLDTCDYKLYKKLPEGALLIFDTLRASHSLDENSSRDMQLIMGRLKELRDAGFTILVLHHTGKVNRREYKGSTAIFDLCDHVLSFYKVKKGSLAEIQDEDFDGDYCFRLGTQDKSRYAPFEMYVEFDSLTKRFKLSGNPDDETLGLIAGLLSGKEPMNQSSICKLVKDELGVNRVGKITSLLKKGAGRYWKVTPTGVKNTILYTSL